MNKESIFEFLKTVPAFSCVSKETLQELTELSHVTTYKKKETIFFEGSSGSYGYLILKGSVSLVKTARDGKELIVALLPQGEPFGTLAVLDEREFPLSAVAQSDAEVLETPRAALQRAWDQEPELAKHFLNVIGSRLRETHELASALAHERAEVRIASALMSLQSRLMSDHKGTVILRRQELADLSGTTIETATRISKNMERQDILDLSKSGKILILDLERLQAILEGEILEPS